MRRRIVRRLRRLRSRLEVRLPRSDRPLSVGEERPSEIDFDAVWQECERLYRGGLHPAVALTIFHRGQCVLDRAIGAVDHQPGRPPRGVVTTDTPFNIFSASKIVTATLVHALAEDGVLDLDAPVARYLPEFGRRGKERVLLRHLLNHSAGLADMPPRLDAVRALMSGELDWPVVWDMPLQFEPGTAVAYHPITSWFILQELIERVTGQGLQTLLHERVTAPLGIGRMGYGVPQEQVSSVAKHVSTGLRAPGVMASIFERTVGAPLERAVGLSNSEAFLTSVLPSANVCATGRELCELMQMWLNQGVGRNGARVLRPETTRRATTEVTPRQLDGTLRFPMRYGLGFMMGGMRFSLYGLNTKGAYGHLGFTGVVVYADPLRDLAVAYLNTGKPMLAPGMLQWYWVLQRLALQVPRRLSPWQVEPAD